MRSKNINRTNRLHRFYYLKSVCIDCAIKAGFALKDKVFATWLAKCAVCGNEKPTADLVHDFYKGGN